MWGPFPELSLGGCPSLCDSSGDSDSDTGPRRLRTTLRFGGKKRRFGPLGPRGGWERGAFPLASLLSPPGMEGMGCHRSLGMGQGDTGDTEGTRGTRRGQGGHDEAPPGPHHAQHPGVRLRCPGGPAGAAPARPAEGCGHHQRPRGHRRGHPGPKKKKKGGQPTPHRFGRDLGMGWEV